MRCVASRLRSLPLAERVLDRVRVQAELLGQLAGQVVVGRDEVGPYQTVWFGEEVGDLFKWEILLLERPVAPNPRADRMLRHGHQCAAVLATAGATRVRFSAWPGPQRVW